MNHQKALNNFQIISSQGFLFFFFRSIKAETQQMNFYIYLILAFHLLVSDVNGLFEGIYCGRDNCYDLLNVTRSANRQEISKAYRNLAKKYHPDMARTAEDKQTYTEQFRAFANAYEILRDEETRADYDPMLDNPDQ